MSTFEIRNFASKDIPQVMALQQAYQHIYPQAAQIPGEAYLSPGFEAGKNIFCAWDLEGSLLGYAPLLPVLTDDPRLPHTVWAEVKVGPQVKATQEVKDGLFQRVLQRVKEISAAFPGHPTRLTFQYHPSEIPAMEYVTSRGCAYTESVFRMMRDLSEEIQVVPPPDSIDVRRWHMESEAERQAYVQARNEAFPEAPVTLAEWQSFLGSPAWQEGTAVTAFDGPEIAGSLVAFWDEIISQMSGRNAGYTEYIFVREKWRHRGIAAFMIYQGLLYLKEHGREAAFLEVKAANANALGLYQRLGYQMVDETRLFVLQL